METVKQPLVSVLIANYNNGKYLEETLSSIYNQQYSNWEIIIVDDCSTDNSRKIYESLSANKQIKIFFNDQNRGCGYTKRRCAEESSGEICAFIDPDDTVTTDALKIMVEKHLENPDCSLIHSRFYYCDKDLNITSEFSAGKNVESGQPYFFNLDGSISHLCSFKKEFYDKTERIDPYLKRAVDQDLYLKLYDAGRTVFLDMPLYYYRIHNEGISTNANARKAYFWLWYVIFNTAKRRGINLENTFFDYFTPKHEYEYIENKYNKFRKVDKLIDKIKSLFGK